MPSFAFQGFSVGSSVALSVEQGGDTASSSVMSWGQSENLADVNISHLASSSLVAPAVLFLKANPVSGFTVTSAPPGTPYDPDHHEITYIWTIRQNNQVFERAPYLNMPEDWKDANVYYGPEVCIVLNDADTYDIDLLAIDRDGNTGTSSAQFAVVDADVGFPGSATICYSETNFNGAPAGATQISSPGALASALAGRTGSNTRLLFRTDGDFRSSFTSQIGLSNINASASVAVGSFGPGNNKPILPLLKQSASGNSCIFGLDRDGQGAKFYNIDMRGGWDATTETGYQGASPIWRDTTSDILFHRCRISGHSSMASQARDGDCYFVWSDSENTDWQNFGLFGYAHSSGNKRFAIIGSDIHQHEDALQGALDNSDKNLSNAHGPFRWEAHYPAANGNATDTLYMHCADMFSRSGWSVGGGGSADQPCLRLNSAGGQDVRMVADRCAFEGGYQVIKMRGEDLGTIDVPGNYVFDKILTIGSPETQWHIENTYGGATFRNCYAFQPNTPMISGGLVEGLFTFNPNDGGQDNSDSPVTVHNCTFVSLLSTTNNRAENAAAPANVPGIDTSGVFGNFIDENNIEYMPNQDTPRMTTPVDTSSSLGISLRFKGLLQSQKPVSGFGNGTNRLAVPYSSFLDWNGNATNRSYWQAREAAGSNRHSTLHYAEYQFLFSDLGEITTDLSDPNNLQLERATGIWPSGQEVGIKLDHSDIQPPLDMTYDNSGEMVPAAALLGAVDAAGGVRAEDRFDRAPRPGSKIPGAPGGTPQKGAI